LCPCWSLLVSAGLAQYSGDPKTEWHLNSHPTKASLLDAIANLPYKGGNTMTGELTAGSLSGSCRLVGLCRKQREEEKRLEGETQRKESDQRMVPNKWTDRYVDGWMDYR